MNDKQNEEPTVMIQSPAQATIAALARQIKELSGTDLTLLPPDWGHSSVSWNLADLEFATHASNASHATHNAVYVTGRVAMSEILSIDNHAHREEMAAMAPTIAALRCIVAVWTKKQKTNPSTPEPASHVPDSGH